MPEDSEKKLVIYWDIKRILSIICALLIIPTLIVFLFSFTLKRTVINPNFYKATLKKADVYNRLIQDGIPALVLELNTDNDAINNSIAKDLIVYVLQKSIDPAWVESLVNKTIDQTVVFYSSFSRGEKEINLDLKKTNLFLNKVSDNLVLLEKFIPTCSELQSGEGSSFAIDCQKMDVNPDEVKTEVNKIRAKISEVNLGVVNIEKNLSQVNASFALIEKVIYKVNTYLYVSLVLLFLLIVAIVILEFRNLSAMLKLIFMPLIIGSLLGLFIFWLLKISTIGNFDLLSFDLPAVMEEIVSDFLKASIAGIFHYFEIITGIILGISLVVYIGLLVLQRTKIKFLGRRW